MQITYANGDPIYTAASQLRKSYQTSNAVNFDIAMSNGVMILTMTAKTTDNIVGGRYVSDAELTAFDNTVIRIIEGIVTVKPQATR